MVATPPKDECLGIREFRSVVHACPRVVQMVAGVNPGQWRFQGL